MNHNAISPLVSPPKDSELKKPSIDSLKTHCIPAHASAQPSGSWDDCMRRWVLANDEEPKVWFRWPQLVVADKNDVCHCLSIKKKVMWCLPPACAKHINGLRSCWHQKKGKSSIHFHPVLPLCIEVCIEGEPGLFLDFHRMSTIYISTKMQNLENTQMPNVLKEHYTVVKKHCKK